MQPRLLAHHKLVLCRYYQSVLGPRLPSAQSGNLVVDVAKAFDVLQLLQRHRQFPPDSAQHGA